MSEIRIYIRGIIVFAEEEGQRPIFDTFTMWSRPPPPPTLDIRMTLVLKRYWWIICCICHKTQPTKFGSGFLHSQITFKTERHIQLYDEESLKEGPKKKHDRTERT